MELVTTRTENNKEEYKIHASHGKFLLLAEYHAYEGCSVDDILMFRSVAQMEDYIDAHPLRTDGHWYEAIWITPE